MSYLVLARKYRPKSFDDFVGQEAIAQTLRNAVDSDRVAHAYLFSGDRGLGKTSMVRVFAKALNCEKGPTGNPCNKCGACTAIHRGDDIDVVEIDGASHRTVDEISEVLQNVKYRPSRSRFKIYIIDEVHMLSTHAFNALLKTLEEPPPHVKFFFATTEANKVLDTIKSRCQRFDFRRISPPAIAERLGSICKEEKVKADEPTLMAVARSARGSMRDALSLMDQLMSFCGKKITVADVQQILGLVTDEKISALVEGMARRDAAAILKDLDELVARGADVLDLLDQLIEYLRDLMVVASCKGDIELVKNKVSDGDTVARQSKSFSVEKLLHMIQMLSEARRKVREGLDPRVVAEMMLVRLAAVEDVQSLSEIVRKLEALEMRASRGAPAAAAPPRSSYGAARGDCGSTQKKTTYSAEPDNPPASDELIGPSEDELIDLPADEVREPEGPLTARETPRPAPPVGAIGISTVNGRWGEVADLLRAEKVSLGLFLSEGRIESVENGCIVLAFAPEHGLHRKRLEERPHKELLEECMAKVFGAHFQVKFVTSEKAKEESAERAEPSRPARIDLSEIMEKEPMVKKAVELFGGHIVRVEE